MKNELEKILFEKFESFFPKDFSIECDDGWYNLIYQICDYIESDIKYNSSPKIKFTQIKEKFGGLRNIHRYFKFFSTRGVMVC